MRSAICRIRCIFFLLLLHMCKASALRHLSISAILSILIFLLFLIIISADTNIIIFLIKEINTIADLGNK